MNQGNHMTKLLTTRRRLLQGAGLGAAVLAAPALVRAAPASANFAFFVSTSPFMIAKGDGSIEQAAGAKVNWIEVASGAEINTGMAAGSMDIGFGIGFSPTASAGCLEVNHLTQRYGNVLDLRGDAMMAAWTRGDIDAGYIWSPVKSKMLTAGGGGY